MAEVNKGSSSYETIIGIHEIRENKLLWKMLMAEFLGTLILVAIGCGSCLGESSIIQIALTFGLTVAFLVQIFGHTSGCHINPAVTMSMFVTGNINLVRAILYIFVQTIGGIAGASLLWALVPDELTGSLGMTQLTPFVHPSSGFVLELFFTFILLLVIHAVTDARRRDITGSVPLCIGLTVTAIHLSGIHLTGSSINPARSFGPCVVMDSWDNQWIYWLGPILGGILAGILYKFVFKVQKGDDDSYDF